jgi:hypothetical protein
MTTSHRAHVTGNVIEPTSAALHGRPDSFDRRDAMHLIPEELARAHMERRLSEAAERRIAARARDLRRAERLRQRAERAQRRARHALAVAVMNYR